MIKYFCDVCQKEKPIRIVNLPTLSSKGRGAYLEGARVNKREQVAMGQFDLCNECLGDLSLYIYKLTHMMQFDDE